MLGSLSLKSHLLCSPFADEAESHFPTSPLCEAITPGQLFPGWEAPSERLPQSRELSTSCSRQKLRAQER